MKETNETRRARKGWSGGDDRNRGGGRKVFPNRGVYGFSSSKEGGMRKGKVNRRGESLM